ncbi:MAG: DNA-directed RNA polymerase subunit beta' [Chloroflexota bacterium]|nr:DNA-directed RNA polymerase subunit beta' [Chloroflexota bacterium]
MLEVNNFNAVRITLASPEQIRSWSRGEVTKPETINYRTLKPERDGLFCERIFGPQKDWECACGKYKRVRYKGIVCDKCGVEVTRAKVRRERMGHIELASPVSHIWFVKGTPSRIGLLLDMTPRILEQILYFAKYVVIDVHETQRVRLVSAINQDLEAKISRQERANQEKIEELTGDLNRELERLENEKTERLQPLEGRREQSVASATERVSEIEAQLEEQPGKVLDTDITLEMAQAPIVRAGERVGPDARRRLLESAKEYMDRLEADTLAEQEKIAAEYDSQIDKLRYDIQGQRQKVLDESLAESDLKATAEARIKRLEALKPRDTLSEMEFRELQDSAGRMFRAGMGAEAIRDLLRNISLDELSAQLRTETHSTSGQKRKKATKRLRVVESFRKSGNRPEWMIFTTLPVLPPDLRPMVQLDGGRFATSDLNDLYRRVINRNNRLKRLLELQAPEIIIRNEKRMLQEAVDSLIDNGRRGRPVSGSSNHKLKSLSDMLKGKQGRFRQNLLGKRVDYSGRSVIVVGPTLQLHQCGLPKRMALELFKPFVMRKLVEKGLAHNIKSAKRIVERVRPEVWDVLEEVIQDHPVLLNRAPTLHRLGIQAFEPILIEGSAIQIHPLVCSAFNADFDGDQMAVHVPLSAAAKKEAREQMLSVNNLLQPSNGDPIVAPTLDMVLGVFYLTMARPGAKGEGKAFSDFDDAKLAYDIGVIDLQAQIKLRIPSGAPVNGESEEEPGSQIITTTMGRAIFNDAINSVLRTHGQDSLAYFNEIVDRAGLKKIVAGLIRRFGNEDTAQVLDAIKRLGFRYATQSGTTIAISDITMPNDKGSILKLADDEVQRIERDYRRGLITDDERYNEVIEVWTRAKDQVTKAVSSVLDPFGPVAMMAQSGAKGNIQQISQMSGMRGLMADPSGRIIELPIRSSFRDGLTVLEYFLSTHGARKGLADTAIRTADSGYLTRRLIDVSQNVIVYEEDCGTELGIWIYDLVEPARRDLRLAQLPGRVLAKDLVDEATGEVVVERNTVIDEQTRDRIAAARELPQMYLRSPLTCEARHGICQYCYGWHLGTRRMVGVGDAVGIVAAQSIGEPGTQLTMRTFHTGGVAGIDITSGLPRVEELFEARVPKGKAILAELDGVVELQRTEDSRIIKVISRQTYRDEHDLPKGYKATIENGAWVEMNQVVAASEKESDSPIVARLTGSADVSRNKVTITSEEREEREYTVPASARSKVEDGQPVQAGDLLTEGSKDPDEVLRIQGRDAVQRYLIDEVQEVYRSQGVSINDKHIEVIARQMLRKLRVDQTGDTELLPGELVDRFEFEDKNRQVLAEGGEPATALPVLLGVTKASLNTESFLAAASFQETTKVLTEAAISGKVDKLLGLKENVIIGKLIPAGTGLAARQQARRERLVAQQQLMLEAGPLPAGFILDDGQPVTLAGPLGEGLAGVGVPTVPTRLEDLEDDDDEELLDDEELVEALPTAE